MHKNKRQLRTSALNMHPELLVMSEIIPARLPRPFRLRRRLAALSFLIFQLAHEHVFSTITGGEMLLFPKVSQIRCYEHPAQVRFSARRRQERIRKRDRRRRLCMRTMCRCYLLKIPASFFCIFKAFVVRKYK